MGFLKDLVGAAAPIVGGIFGGPAGAAIGGLVGGAVSGGGSSGASQSGTQTTTQQQQLDPRIQQMLFGSGGNNGLLNQFQGYLNQPQTPGSKFIGDLSSNFLSGPVADDVNAVRNAGFDLIKGNQAPAIGAAQSQAAQVNAPSQNALNLSPAYQNLIYGNAAENPYLKQSLQAGVDQSTQAFNTQLGNLTDTLQRNILPSIRGGAIASGQYGGSRQGIAEGLAMSDLTKQATNAAQAFGLGNTAATTGAYANAFNQGQDRSLSALQGLSGQQYNTAITNANLQQQAALENARLRQQADLSNAGFGMQNYAQNNAAKIAGAGLLSGNLDQMYGYNQNAQNADLQRAQGVAGLLSPFIGVNQSSTSSSPLYQNKTSNALGTAAAGLGLYNTLTGDNAIGNSLFKAFGGLGGSL